MKRSTVLLAALLAAVFLLPSQVSTKSPVPFLVVLLLAEGIYLVQLKRTGKKSASDIISALYLLLLVWELATKLGLAHPVLVPPPENVFYVFYSNRVDLLDGLVSSLKLLVWGIGLAMVLGIFGGLAVGYVQRLREAVLPIARVMSTIPPLVYTPYVVAVMPSFYTASIFVIFSAVFWPTFMSMIARVGSIDQKILDSARVMNLSVPEMLFKIILPYSLPDVIGRLSLSLTSAMLCLTGAEMLGARAGMGYFVKKFSDYADYTKVIAGIIFIAIVVTILNQLVLKLQQKVIKWRY
jgi:NitT/TauT family transport system permease protein